MTSVNLRAILQEGSRWRLEWGDRVIWGTLSLSSDDTCVVHVEKNYAYKLVDSHPAPGTRLPGSCVIEGTRIRFSVELIRTRNETGSPALLLSVPNDIRESDRRRSPRISVLLDASLSFLNGSQTFDTLVRNISATGARVVIGAGPQAFSKEPKNHDSVQLGFESESIGSMSVRGEVARSLDRARGTEIGIRFLEDSRVVRQVSTFIEQISTDRKKRGIMS